LIINNRIGAGRQGMAGFTKDESYAGDFGTPEQEIPDTGAPGVDWESCMTMNDTWGYKHFDDNWKSAEALIRNLVDIASKGGNYLLNIGPKADGTIPEESVERLKAIGAWMKINGDSIYGTQASPYEKPEWGRYTTKNGKLFAHVFDWPDGGGKIQVPLDPEDVDSVHFIAGGEKLDFTPVTLESGSGIEIHLPAEALDAVDTIIVIE
jgi:alpha-L-fucosidase